MSSTIRQACLWIHRYSGLVIALFLFLAGITGALLAFHDELDDVFNHKLAYVERQSVASLPIATLHDKVIQTYPEFGFSSMPVAIEPNKSAVFSVDRQREAGSSSDKGKKAPFQDVYVNPYSGDIIGTRDKKEWAWRNTMDKVFFLHRELLLGKLGELILGVTALIWTINCFIGFYLTLPRAVNTNNNKIALKRSHESDAGNRHELQTGSAVLNKSSILLLKKPAKKWASLFKRWLPAWKIRTKTNFFKLNYDLHHAFGLWLWVMLFVIAWSSVGFNLNQVYQPVMEAVVQLEPQKARAEPKPNATLNAQKNLNSAAITDIEKEQKPASGSLVNNDRISPNLPLTVSKEQSIDYLTTQANLESAAQDVKVVQRLGIRWIDEDQQWQMRFKTNKDIGTKGGVSSVTVDAKTGKVVKTNFGHQKSIGSDINQWLMSLHMGNIGLGVFHVLYQIFLALVGLAVSVLSFTGVYLWWRGRGVRKRTANKTQARQ